MRKNAAIVTIALSLVSGDALAAQSACPLIAARYGLIGYPEFTASFQSTPPAPGWESNLALRIVADNRSFWFMFDESGAAGDVNLVRTTDPSSPGWSRRQSTTTWARPGSRSTPRPTRRSRTPAPDLSSTMRMPPR